MMFTFQKMHFTQEIPSLRKDLDGLTLHRLRPACPGRNCGRCRKRRQATTSVAETVEGMALRV